MTLAVASDISWGWVVVLALLPVVATIVTNELNKRSEDRRRREDHAREDSLRFLDERREIYGAAVAAVDSATRLERLRHADLLRGRTPAPKTAEEKDLIEIAQRKLAEVGLLGSIAVGEAAAVLAKASIDYLLAISGIAAGSLDDSSGVLPLFGDPAERVQQLNEAQEAFRQAIRADLGVPD